MPVDVFEELPRDAGVAPEDDEAFERLARLLGQEYRAIVGATPNVEPHYFKHAYPKK